MVWHKIIVCGLYRFVKDRSPNGVIYLSRVYTRNIDENLREERIEVNIKKLYNLIVRDKDAYTAITNLVFPRKPSPLDMRQVFLVLARKGYEPEHTIVKHAVTKGYIELCVLKEVILDKCCANDSVCREAVEESFSLLRKKQV